MIALAALLGIAAIVVLLIAEDREGRADVVPVSESEFTDWRDWDWPGEFSDWEVDESDWRWER